MDNKSTGNYRLRRPLSKKPKSHWLHIAATSEKREENYCSVIALLLHLFPKKLLLSAAQERT